jgi:hypothetical protein
MRHLGLSFSLLLLTSGLIAPASPAITQKATIRWVKNTLASSLDKTLPKMTLESFLKDEGKGAPIAWAVKDCGQQVQNPEIADRTEHQTCVKADMKLKDGRLVTVSVAVRAHRPPAFFSASVKDPGPNGSLILLYHLSDLPIEINHPTMHNPYSV